MRDNVRKYKEQVYLEFKEEINLISKASEKNGWKADIGVATDMFISFIENAKESVFVNVRKAKARIAELKELYLSDTRD